MAEQIQLEVVTPERRVLAEPVDSVNVPGLNGELGILPGHTPLISQLQTGVLSYVQNGVSHRLHVSGGFVEVNGDRVSVLAEIAEHPEEIDAARARMTREHAEKTLRLPAHDSNARWSGCRSPVRRRPASPVDSHISTPHLTESRNDSE